METKIFKNYKKFSERTDQSINGVSEVFAEKFPNYKEMNQTNTGCWNCYNCTDCENCRDCKDCVDCYECQYCEKCQKCDWASNCWQCGNNEGNHRERYLMCEREIVTEANK